MRQAYKEADDPCFDDVQIGWKDGEPRHEDQKRRVGSWKPIRAAEMLPSLDHGSGRVRRRFWIPGLLVRKVN